MNLVISNDVGFTSYSTKSGEDYMNPRQLIDFKQQLQRLKSALLEDVDRTVSQMQVKTTSFPDPNDRASQEEELTVELRARDRDRQMIHKINESLKNIEIGDYGYCEKCGVEIGLKRMQARPTATKCIECKEIDEQREKRALM